MKRDRSPDGSQSTPSSAPDRFIPSEHWLEMFDAQCTGLLLQRARRYAAQRANDLGWETPGAGAYDPDDIVDDIVTDTLAGALRWDPQKRDFASHLYDAVRSRVTRYARRMVHHPHESIDAVDSAGESPLLAEMETQLRADAPEATIETRMRVDEAVHILQNLAHDKPLVQRLLMAFERRAFDKEDVMHEVNLTPAEYHNARRQLARLLDQLPSHLKPGDDVIEEGA
jgi:hypothetical protein